MPHVSLTRLRIRSFRFMPHFALLALQTRSQVARADGYLAGSLLPDRSFTFWTMTAWRDRAAMLRYMTSGAHMKAMPYLLDWCDEASVTHWEQDSATLPPWAEAEQRMRSTGRPSKVRNPSPHHADLSFAPARTTAAGPVPPARARKST